MSSTLVKEFRPLVLPACVAIAGSILPPTNDLYAMLGSLACFGGFALLAAMVFGLEFQNRTLGLLLSQPTERSRLWQDKLLSVSLAAVAVGLLNWQFQQLLLQLPASLLLLVWMFLVASVCSTGFWIQSTGSTAVGIACSVLNQVLVFGGLALAVGYKGFNTGFAGDEVLVTVVIASTVYFATFLWLGRRFLQGAFLKLGTGAFLFLLLCWLSWFLAENVRGWQSSFAETCLAGVFLVATVCSAGYWTLVARTTIGGAVLSVAAQFLAGLGALLGLARIYGADPDVHQARFLGPMVMVSILYCAVFLWLGWRKFARLELRESPAGENLLQSSGFFYQGRWSPGWIRCRGDQHLLNLVRKELRLQKPLLMLAGIFLICWLASYALQLLQPDRGYGNLKDLVVCLYAPVALLLAGCISLGDEKVLGLTAWHLTLPIAARTQWLVKLVVAAVAAATLGLLFPLGLDLVSAAVTGGGFLLESKGEAWIAISTISGSLFVLSFWAATLLTSTVRAALSAVVALVAFSLCGALGGWCAEHLELWRTAFFPVVDWLIIPLSHASRVLKPSETAFLLGLVLAGATALLQSFHHFRRAQVPTAVSVKAMLALAGLFALLGFIVSSTDYCIAAGGYSTS
jgi:hypothetical protein